MAMKKRLLDTLEQTSYLELSQEDLTALFTGTGQIAQTEGILALHELEVLCEDSLLRQNAKASPGPSSWLWPSKCWGRRVQRKKMGFVAMTIQRQMTTNIAPRLLFIYTAIAATRPL